MYHKNPFQATHVVHFVDAQAHMQLVQIRHAWLRRAVMYNVCLLPLLLLMALSNVPISLDQVLSLLPLLLMVNFFALCGMFCEMFWEQLRPGRVPRELRRVLTIAMPFLGLLVALAVLV